MVDSASEQILLKQAIQGDQDALTDLLLAHYDALERYLRRKIPAHLQATLAVEDVIQEAHIQVFRKIADFTPSGDAAFYRWLVTITKKCLLDKLKSLQRHKRGGQHRRVHAPASNTSVATLLAVVAQDSLSPSRCVARREREQAIHIGLAGLKEDYRQALTLRYVEGLPVADIAQRMNRTERAVHMLCNRGIKRLKEIMGSRSRV